MLLPMNLDVLGTVTLFIYCELSKVPSYVNSTYCLHKLYKILLEYHRVDRL